MADHSMDSSTLCSNCDVKARELTSMQEKYEGIYQEHHELKRKVEVLDKVQSEYESEISFFSVKRSEDQSALKNIKTEFESAVSKIQTLESLLEEEKLTNRMLRIEIKENKDEVNPIKAPTVPDENEISTLMEHIQKLEADHENSKICINELEESKKNCINEISQLKCEKQALQNELTEIKEHLQQKTDDLQNVKTSLESVREEKLLLSSELQVLKVSDTNAARGNSLFAEVEENRQKMAAQREMLKMKYLNLKKVVSQKTVENNKLKMEIVKIRREEKDDDKNLIRDYSVLIQTYKERISELEKELRILQQQQHGQPQIVLTGENSSQLQWVHTLVENARKEAQTLRQELDRRGYNYVVQGHQLFDSQKDNRKLKAAISKLQSEIDELRFQLDTLKAANANVDDGISPPATDIIIEYQRQKVVKFQDVLQKSHDSITEKEEKVTVKEEK